MVARLFAQPFPPLKLPAPPLWTTRHLLLLRRVSTLHSSIPLSSRLRLRPARSCPRSAPALVPA